MSEKITCLKLIVSAKSLWLKAIVMSNNSEVKDILKLIYPMSTERKLEIIFRLTKEIKSDLPSKIEESSMDDLIEELYGSWNDVDESVLDEILNSRTISDRRIFDT